MPHQVETQSSAINPATTACTVRKRLILLCCEDLRPVACALEGALRNRGWEVDVEFGADARPWVQKAPPVQPSVRVLCVPGTIDRAFAEQLRAAFRPDPEADLHILGIDDSPGLVYEIERLAGVKHPRRRSLHAQPPMAGATRLEVQARRDRSWRVAATAALAAFVITLGGLGTLDWAQTIEPTASNLGTSITSLTSSTFTSTLAEEVERLPPRMDDPVLSTVAFTAPMDWVDDAVPEEDFELVIDGDEALEPTVDRRVHVLATPLAAPASAITITDAVAITDAVTLTDAAALTDAVTISTPLPSLPAGFLPVAGLVVSDAALTKPARQLPRGFLPVAGMTAAPRITTVDPFEASAITTAAPFTTVDPFIATL